MTRLALAALLLSVAAFGVLVHLLIIAPVLNSPPLNQLLATGGLLFFLQSFATLLFGTEFRNIGVRLPILEIATIYISFARLVAFALGLVGAVALYFFLKRTYIGTAIRAIAQDRDIVGLMGVDQETRRDRAQRAGALLDDLQGLSADVSEVFVLPSGDVRIVLRGSGEVLLLGEAPFRPRVLTFLSLRKDLVRVVKN